jgi:large repetitive protein
MRLNRPQRVATEGAQTAGVRRRIGAGAIRVLSVTAVAAATCSLWVGGASAATAHATKHATTTTVSVSPKTAFVGEAVKLASTVSGGRTPTGKVTFKIDGIKVCTVRLARGKASCRVAGRVPHAFVVRAFYLGNSTHKTSSSGVARLSLIRSKTTTKIASLVPDPVKDGVTVVVTVHVSVRPGAPAANGTVNVAPTNVVPPVDAGYDCTATVINGTGSCDVTPPTPSFGLVDYQAKFVANSRDKASTSATDVLPVQETTTTTVTPGTAAAGSVTLNADVVSAGEADISPPGGSGTVAFYIGTTPIGGCGDANLTNPTKGEDNVATCTTTLAAGTYTINAVYSGDDVNLTSTGTETLTVS